ncbi:cellulose synthase subunit BcsC-related outer membrane protein [Dendronalium sp. ChiSLP03b]|uniref:cellulose synthase subunit BcsC-related outer membrane protein n=1 Tax=Dendronalium sp. ChiSLP03b TaxID=3075381 RepID=UPI002AD49827|nr:cellulose synthase subunit BcsC-related outer membrane protein [Dendronalium sp. ChiSLP03b]MDZ8204341.1 cellulose synthase subunit BcsC-related outer membrane protein [Dendronalium sp. ChiSLP03b]
MVDNFRRYLFVFRYNLYAGLTLGCLQMQLGVICSIGIWTFSVAKSQAVQPHQNWKSASELIEQVTKANPESTEQHSKLKTLNLELSIPLPYRLELKPILIAAPENFNPGLRLPPALPKPLQNSNQPTTSTEPRTPDAVLESIDTDYRYDTDNFGQTNLFIEPTAQFRLRNGNKIFFKTGFDFFEQPGIESITNVPLQVGWQGKIGQVTLQTAAGVDIFNRLPTALNLNAKVELPISPAKVTPSGRLRSLVVLSGNLEQGPYKSNARTLDNQITAWRFGPDLYWQIDRDTSLFSSLRLGSYNDGNSEVQSFSRLERKFGQFSLAANLFTWNYDRDLERTSGYFSPQDFLVYNAEVAWEGDITKFLRCRLAANLGRQRLKGEFDNANTYQTRCTVKLSPNIEADLGYSFSNVRNQDTGESAYSGNSLAGQLRVKF